MCIHFSRTDYEFIWSLITWSTNGRIHFENPLRKGKSDIAPDKKVNLTIAIEDQRQCEARSVKQRMLFSRTRVFRHRWDLLNLINPIISNVVGRISLKHSDFRWWSSSAFRLESRRIDWVCWACECSESIKSEKFGSPCMACNYCSKYHCSYSNERYRGLPRHSCWRSLRKRDAGTKYAYSIW